MTIFCTKLPWRIFDFGPKEIVNEMQAAAVAAAGRTTMPARAAPQRHLTNRHATLVSGSDSYALLFLLFQIFTSKSPAFSVCIL